MLLALLAIGGSVIGNAKKYDHITSAAYLVVSSPLKELTKQFTDFIDVIVVPSEESNDLSIASDFRKRTSGQLGTQSFSHDFDQLGLFGTPPRHINKRSLS